jgi:hypothetical protein
MKTYVYRLHVTYPPNSLEWGWEPPGWDPDAGTYGSYDLEEAPSFRWPQNRLCLSARTARRRADMFRKYGAEVVIERSGLVTWPGETP